MPPFVQARESGEVSRGPGRRLLEISNREQTRQSRSDALRTVQGIVVGQIIKVGRRARSVRHGRGRWPLAKAHDRGESNQHPALLERQDCALVTWYRSLYAPSRGRGV